jgi:hypothetical protein
MNQKTILFHANQIGLRGTEVALYDYAVFNEELLGNKSIIISRRENPGHNIEAIEKFKRRFEVFFHDESNPIDKIISSVHADFLYMIKGGERDGLASDLVPNLVHAVFPSKANDYHGDVYAYISQWLSQECSQGAVPYVPFIVRVAPASGDLRSLLKIPSDALVLGCHGGETSFDIPFVRTVVAESIKYRSDIFFVFLNIEPFTDHPRIIFLPGTPDMDFKSKFIATCDGMLHARRRGESFGLACGEFSISNKPIWTYAHSEEKSHIQILGDKAIIYENDEDLRRSILNTDREKLLNKSWDMYSSNYSPQAVMEKFNSVFLSSAA